MMGKMVHLHGQRMILVELKTHRVNAEEVWLGMKLIKCQPGSADHVLYKPVLTPGEPPKRSRSLSRRR
jgi:hypothetical protein